MEVNKKTPRENNEENKANRGKKRLTLPYVYEIGRDGICQKVYTCKVFKDQIERKIATKQCK